MKENVKKSLILKYGYNQKNKPNTFKYSISIQYHIK